MCARPCRVWYVSAYNTNDLCMIRKKIIFFVQDFNIELLEDNATFKSCILNFLLQRLPKRSPSWSNMKMVPICCIEEHIVFSSVAVDNSPVACWEGVLLEGWLLEAGGQACHIKRCEVGCLERVQLVSRFLPGSMECTSRSSRNSLNSIFGDVSRYPFQTPYKYLKTVHSKLDYWSTRDTKTDYLGIS